jgi:hypothetical protein
MENTRQLYLKIMKMVVEKFLFSIEYFETIFQPGASGAFLFFVENLVVSRAQS